MRTLYLLRMKPRAPAQKISNIFQTPERVRKILLLLLKYNDNDVYEADERAHESCPERIHLQMGG